MHDPWEDATISTGQLVVVVCVLLFIGLCAWLSAHGQTTETRHYFPVAPSAMAANHHTHVEVAGRVTLSKREGDGDWHMRLIDETTRNWKERIPFVVAECIPELPCLHPKVGQCVKVRGISRLDGEHKWPEVHPVEKLEVMPCRK